MHTSLRAVLAAVTALSVGSALAPATAEAQTNTFGYTMATATYDYVAPPAGTATLGLTDDSQALVTLPFTFDYFGGSYTQVEVQSNGGVNFVAGTSLSTLSSCLPASFASDILVYWDDLNPAAGGDVYHWYDAAGDRYIISWEDVFPFSGFAGGTWQIQLYSGGTIELHWTDTDFGDPSTDDGAEAVIGIQDVSGGTLDPLEWSCNTSSVLENTAVSFSTCSDSDGDGYDDATCGGDDCDDADSAVNPGATETCDNAVDEDCSGVADVSDGDSDTYTNIACPGGDDCDDSDAALNPGIDADGDGSNVCDDCNDSPGLGAFLFPGNTEVCGDGIDQDCSGGDDLPDVDGDTYIAVACGGDDCDDTDATVNPGTDIDGDTYSVCDGDCDDLAPSAFPGNPEICDNGIDNDCDGTADDVDADGDGDLAIPCGGTDCDDNDPTVGATTDADSDGSNACLDCDDTDPTIYPGAPELCDTTDSDCDGLDDAFDLDVNAGGTTLQTSNSNSPGQIFSNLIGPSPSTTFITAGGIIQDLDVTVNVTYSPLTEIDMIITSPMGTSVTLFNAGGLSGSNIASMVFDDEATDAISAGTSPYTGSFIPTSALSAFDGEDSTGLWEVLATSTNIIGIGTLDSVILDITVGTVDDSDGDGAVDSCGDCDDTDATVYPGAPETCGDGIDQDCDGVDATGDVDGDTYIDADCGGDDCDDSDASINPGVDGDADGSNVCDDCDDADPNNFPGNLEICADGIDQDCSGADDDGDSDNDGYVSDVCIGGDDCDDTNAAVFPGAFDQDGDGYDICDDCYEIAGDTEALINPDEEEVCDGLDNDCDGVTDNQDADGDGFVNDACFGGEDCDDADPTINPQADADGDGFHACIDCDDATDTIFPGGTEICGDGIDQNGTGSDPVGDDDGDGYDSEVCDGDDCDDNDANANPGATEICDGVDLDCDEVTTTVDNDGDGFFDVACGGTDCDDDAISVHPDAIEVCDGIDNNCDGALLEGGEQDEDGDGVAICADDCDDTDPLLYPGADEVCDQADNDCDGEADEGLITDGDQDGFIRAACGGDDCDDQNPDSFPGATEDCSDGGDNDCDGLEDSEDDDCDFGNSGCDCSTAADGGSGSTAAFALLLGIVGVVRRRRPGARA
ncbi:MAG: hypothetical protein KDA24_03690 [Deltaproteobacteria bacterium]|nr:hypothetical protein [Deltaproteobacteria bacterium]